jgi:hypothetical protein
LTKSESAINDDRALWRRLDALIGRAGSRTGLGSDLALVTAEIADFFAADACSVMLLKKAEDGGPLRLGIAARSQPLSDEAQGQEPQLGEGLAGMVAESGTPILLPAIADSEFAHLARQASGSCICTPLCVAGRVRGVLNLNRQAEFTPEDLALAGAVALLLGLGQELTRAHGLLRSRFAHRAMADELQRQPDADVLKLGTNAGKMARILGRAFFRELRTAGYGSDHILSAATEIIGELGQDIGGRGKNRRKPRGGNR